MAIFGVRRTRSFIALLLVLTLPLFWPPVAASKARAAVCPAYLLIGSRGSGEKFADRNGLGAPVDQFRIELEKDLGAAVVIDANTYPAVPLAGSLQGWIDLTLSAAYPIGFNLNPFGLSVLVGEMWLQQEVDKWTSACGSSTNLFLAGYSQGALVTADVYQGLSATERGFVTGVALFGEPHFSHTSKSSRGDFSTFRNGILSAPRGEYTDQGKVRSYCHSRDPICQGVFTATGNTPPALDYTLSQHTNYDTFGDTKNPKPYPKLAADYFAGYTGKPLTASGPPLDMAFVVDSTSSMDPYLPSVTANIQNIVAQARVASPDVRIALVDFKDTDQNDPYAFQVDVPFTTDATAFATALSGIAPFGGGDVPEARYSGIMAALNLPWRAGVRKEIIVLTDAAGKDPEPVTNFTAGAVIAKSFAVDPVVIDTLALGSDPAAAAFAPNVTTATGGHLFAGADPTTIVDTIVQAIRATTSAPVAILTPVAGAPTNTNYWISAASSYDPSGKALSYAWDLTNSGNYSVTSDGPLLGVYSGTPGSFPVSVRVTNDSGQSSYATTVVQVVPPGPFTGLPAAPAAVTATNTATTATLSWQAPSSGPTAEAYSVYAADGTLLADIAHGGAGSLTLPASMLPLTVQVQSVNRTGAGGVSAPVVLALPSAVRPTATRLGGVDRTDTSVLVAQAAFGSAKATVAVLSRDDNFADALAGNALAAQKHGPLLLTASGALDPRVGGELRNILAPGSTVYVLGGPGALSPQIEADVSALGFVPKRLAGADRFETAVAVAGEISAHPHTVLVATGDNFPDALAAGAAAASDPAGGVVVLSDDAAMPSATASFLATVDPVASSVYAVGGQAVTALGALAPFTGHVTPLMGSDRFGTALAVASNPVLFPQPTSAGLATGDNWPDALSGGAFVGARNAPLLLADGPGIPDGELGWLRIIGPHLTALTVFGGTHVVPPQAVAQAGDTAWGTGNWSSLL